MVALENIFLVLSIILFVVTSGYILYTCRRTEMFGGRSSSPTPDIREHSPRERNSPVEISTPAPSPSPSPLQVPLSVTSSITAALPLPVKGSSYEMVTSAPGPVPTKDYQPVNPPYANILETALALSTAKGGSKAGGLHTGFIEKTLPESASEKATENARPNGDKISSTPAPLEEEKKTEPPKEESMAKNLANNNSCVQQYLGSCMNKDTILQTTSFVILETNTNDQLYFGIPKELASFYRSGIELTRKEYSTSVKNKVIPFPYTITGVTVPPEYSVFFKTTMLDTDAISIYDSATDKTDKTLKIPILVDPSKYSSVSMVIIPKNI